MPIPMLPTSLLIACLVVAGCDSAPSPRQSKTLLIGIDGVQLERYESLGAGTRLVKQLHYGIAYTGGFDKASEQATLGGPGWMTVLTGVWANKHGVTSDDPSQRLDPAFPSLFKRLRLAQPNAYLSSVVSGPALNTTFLRDDAQGNDVRESGLGDEQVIERTLQILDRSPADFTFVQLTEPDQVGHQAGYGHRYQQALRAADTRIGRLLDEIDSRRHENPQEDWLVIVTTDHGRDERGTGHGGSSTAEKTIFIASNRPLNLQTSQPGPPTDTRNVLYRYAPQTAIAPTILRHMGIEPQAQWQLDGKSLGLR